MIKTNEMQELGENFEYARSIVRDQVELSKIILTEKVASVLGQIIAIVLLVLGFTIGLIIALVIAAILLTKQFGLVVALSIILASILVITYCFYLSRYYLIVKPLGNTLYNAINKST
jgi:hypothetical protein